MPQEIRQMPEDRMVLLVEGQRPIFGSKLRYYATEPHRRAVDKARYPGIDIPDVELGPVSVRTAAIVPDPATREPVEFDIPVVPPPQPKRRVARAIKAEPGQTTSQGAERVSRSARRLKAAVSVSMKQAPEMPSVSRKAIEDILALTIPDPVEVGLGDAT